MFFLVSLNRQILNLEPLTILDEKKPNADSPHDLVSVALYNVGTTPGSIYRLTPIQDDAGDVGKTQDIIL